MPNGFTYISEDMHIFDKEYCIIFGTASQAELTFPAGCYFCTLFYILFKR
nr:MAG TPA: hypothetical protein [Caudoviricetes sp.]